MCRLCRLYAAVVVAAAVCATKEKYILTNRLASTRPLTVFLLKCTRNDGLKEAKKNKQTNTHTGTHIICTSCDCNTKYIFIAVNIRSYVCSIDFILYKGVIHSFFFCLCLMLASFCTKKTKLNLQFTFFFLFDFTSSEC